MATVDEILPTQEATLDTQPETSDDKIKKMSELMSLMMSPTQQINMAAAGASTNLIGMLNEYFPESERSLTSSRGTYTTNPVLFQKMYNQMHDNNFSEVPFALDENKQERIQFIIPIEFSSEDIEASVKFLRQVYYDIIYSFINAFAPQKFCTNSFRFNINSVDNVSFHHELVGDLIQVCTANIVFFQMVIETHADDIAKLIAEGGSLISYFPPHTIKNNITGEIKFPMMKYSTGSSPWTTGGDPLPEDSDKPVKMSHFPVHLDRAVCKNVRNLHLQLQDDGTNALGYSVAKFPPEGMYMVPGAVVCANYWSLNAKKFYENGLEQYIRKSKSAETAAHEDDELPKTSASEESTPENVVNKLLGLMNKFGMK
jgi:hypothetical protein